MRSESSYAQIARARGRFVLMPEQEPNPHIVVCGMSGFGKSTMFGAILRGVVRQGVSCIVFDAHDEHAETVRDLGGTVHENISGGLNLLALDGATVAERISTLTGLLKHVHSLGYIQSTKLSECLWYTYRRFGAQSNAARTLYKEPRIADLIYEVNVFIRNSRSASERNSLLHLRDRLSLLGASDHGRPIDIIGVQSGVHSFSLSGMKSREERTIYLEELLGRIYESMKDGPKQDKISRYIMIDEAQFVISSSDGDMVTRFIEEGRKYGVGVVVATHSSVKLNRQVVANASTFISFYSREPSEAAFVSKVIGAGNAEPAIRSMLSRLRMHQALVFSARNRVPSTISMSRILPARAPSLAQGERERVIRLSLRPIAKEALVRLHHISAALLDRMISDRTLLSFDDDSSLWVSSRRSVPGLEHEVMVMKMHGLLSDSGIKNYVHDRANGPDLVAFDNRGRKVAIEYETGLKNIEESANMISGRLGEYARVIVVTRDTQKYSGLTVPGDIVVVPPSNLNALAAMVRGQ